jgi:hypothetical protein
VKDQGILAGMARGDPDSAVRREAIRYLNDQELLLELAQPSNPDKEARKTAIRRLATESSVAELARDDPDAEIRIVAVKQLNQPELLQDIAKSDKVKGVRLAAAARITDEDALAWIALNDPETTLRKAAVDGLRTRKVLEHVAQATVHDEVRNAVTKRLGKRRPRRPTKKRAPVESAPPFERLETTSAEAATAALFDEALPRVPVWDERSIRLAHRGFVEAWSSRELITGPKADLRRRVRLNLEWTAREPGFHHFEVFVSDQTGAGEVVSWADDRAASVCLWRSRSSLYLCGNLHFR